VSKPLWRSKNPLSAIYLCEERKKRLLTTGIRILMSQQSSDKKTINRRHHYESYADSRGDLKHNALTINPKRDYKQSKIQVKKI
jgi:hypothetical protein